MKLGKTLIALSILAAILAGCSTQAENNNTSISVNGSTSVAELFETTNGHEGLIDAYKVVEPNVTIKMSPTGSSDGIKAAQSGTTEIGMSSRELKAEEKTGLTSVMIAVDAIAIVVNPENSVDNLTSQQLTDIYTGKITNWSEVGGKDAPISVVARESGSGTRGAFEELLEIKDKMVTSANEFNGTGAVRTEVSQNPNAIGYLSLGAVDDHLKAVNLNSVEPTVENVKNESYTLQRPFLLVYKEDVVTDADKAFIDWVLSSEGQQIVTSKKYIAVN